MITFRVNFVSGLEFETDKVELDVKLRCRPLTDPPNAKLAEVTLSY